MAALGRSTAIKCRRCSIYNIKSHAIFGGSAYVGLLEQGLHLEGITKNNKFSYTVGVRNRSNRNLLKSQETELIVLTANTLQMKALFKLILPWALDDFLYCISSTDGMYTRHYKNTLRAGIDKQSFGRYIVWTKNFKIVCIYRVFLVVTAAYICVLHCQDSHYQAPPDRRKSVDFLGLIPDNLTPLFTAQFAAASHHGGVACSVL